MSLSTALLSFLLLQFYPIIIIPTATAAAAVPAYTATDLILLNCGESSKLTDTSNRSWDGDDRSKYAPPNAAAISSPSQASLMDPSVRPVPYQTARVFHAPFTYTFPLLPGPKFLRLHFYAAAAAATNQSFFSVTANAFTLLSNFSASLNSPSPTNPSFMREFVINVEQNQRLNLNLTFTPNPNSFAFINGIEIVSIPDGLYFRGDDAPITFDGQQLFYLRNDTVLENLYRLNVGGGDVRIQDDSGPARGMFRAWAQDDGYVSFGDYGYTPHAENVPIEYTPETPPYSAPEIVYQTSRVMSNTSVSLDWGFPVDSGFYYLLRLHFCEIQLEVTLQNRRVFTISINNKTAEIEADVIFWTGGTQIPIFRDYVTWVPNDGRRGKRNLRLSLFPNNEGHPLYSNALLNGLEIFKLSDSTRSLAAANPDPVPNSPPPPAVVVNPKENRGASIIYAVVGSVIGVLAVAAAVSFLIFRRRKRKVNGSDSPSAKASWVPLSSASRSGSTTRTSRSGVSLPSDLCRHFSLDEIKAATGNFDDNFVIGKGGFGNVYRGYVDDGATAVAIKRLNPSSNQGVHEFLTEIEMLSKLRHLHLVSLIGYCDESGEMILVYDYMARGTLRDHLYNSENSPLTWKDRLRICIGAARGLHYLHTGAKQSIIHRDVKSTNILLDEKWVAKVSDFGLSKVGPIGGLHTHVSTVVKGSFGYVDPEYYRRQQLTDKSDVYSFGVVLFEVLCARPAIIPRLPREQVNLVEWAKFCYRKRTIEQIVDSNLDGQIAPECLSKFVETAVMCVRDKGIERPAMSDVVWSLEFAMQLQEAAEHRGGVAADEGDYGGFTRPLLVDSEANTTTDEEMFSGSSEAVTASKSSGMSSASSLKLAPEDVFSEIKNPLAR